MVEFKQEIDDKVAENSTRNFVFPRPLGEQIRLNTDDNNMDNSYRGDDFNQYTN